MGHLGCGEGEGQKVCAMHFTNFYLLQRLKQEVSPSLVLKVRMCIFLFSGHLSLKFLVWELVNMETDILNFWYMKRKTLSENVEILISKYCAEMFIRGNVWGAPLSGLGNGPCNSDGGENAREIQEKSKRYHWSQEIWKTSK